MKKNIAIIFGGESSEHDISIISAFYTRKYFDVYLYNIFMIYIDPDHNFYLLKNPSTIKSISDERSKTRIALHNDAIYIAHGKKLIHFENIDVVFPVLHGVGGEDGSIDGFLKINNFCRATPSLSVGCIGMDKVIFKTLIKDVVPTLPYVAVEDGYSDEVLKNIKEKVGFPCIVKPARQGSSIGIEISENVENLQKIINKCLNFDKKLIIEPYLNNFREFNIALYSKENSLVLSEIEEPIIRKEILSFEDKYVNFSGGDTAKIKKIPPNISKKMYQQIVDYGSRIYKTLNINGLIRCDFLYDKNSKKLYINEINTIPGSLSLYLFKDDEERVISDLITLAERQFFAEKNKRVEFKSSVLLSENVKKFQ